MDARTLKDLRWLIILLIAVAGIMYVVVLLTVPAVRQPVPLIAFTALLAVHLILHWRMIKILPGSPWMSVYIVAQGGLFLGIMILSTSPNMFFPLFASLIGESIGTHGFSRRGILAVSYYTLMIIIGFVAIFGADGAVWWSLGTLAVLVSSAVYTALYKQQVQARSRAQTLLEELEAANRQLTAYAARVEELTISAERQRMARELHDTLSQGLAGLVLQLEAISAHLKGERPARALAIVEEAMEQARGTLAESRRAITDLRQDGPRDLGESARREAERFASSTGIPCAVEVSLPATLPDPVSEAALRVLVEGLTNVARHAQAGRVDLRIATNPPGDELELEICDNGVGFEPAAVEAGHYGLLGMRERVQLAGGRLEVRSAPGEGTELMIRFPLQPYVQTAGSQ